PHAFNLLPFSFYPLPCALRLEPYAIYPQPSTFYLFAFNSPASSFQQPVSTDHHPAFDQLNIKIF
ncbi:MAG: hypothetical protein KJP23_23815, partial [Deltaproteobacteria bacterium]|nr:hypothetical protein [Deltaproteobacteria bacterium]